MLRRFPTDYNQVMIVTLNIEEHDLGSEGKTVALLADTHTSHTNPDLHPHLLPRLRELRPDIIFHAGDISLPQTLAQLKEMAPCYAVRGNRDLGFQNLPDGYLFSLAGRKVYLSHGHAPMAHYLKDKVHYYAEGFRFSRYYRHLVAQMPTADVYLFGHTHIAFHEVVDGRVFVNPGPAMLPDKHDPYPSFALLHFETDKDLRVEIITL
jgi:putative phosphoesterase